MALLHLSLALFLLAVPLLGPLLLLASAASDPIHADASAARTRTRTWTDHHLHHGASELPNQRAAAGTASRGTPIYPGVLGEVAASHVAERQHHLEMALISLGFNDMAATLLADSPALAWWPGAVTIFAPPEDLLRAFFPGPRRDLLLRHVVLGHFPYDVLASPSTVTLPSVHVGSCLDVSSEPGTRRRGRIVYVHGIEITDPEVYNHGDFIIHAIRRVLPPLHRCLETRPSLPESAPAAATVPIRGAIARLGRGGYGFVALALRALSGELRASTSYFTVFAVADDAILAGGAADYVWGFRFHIVPGRRLTHADLLHLHPGTVLPTLAGDGYNLLVTHGADDDVFVNHVGIKEAEVVTTERLVVHGVHSSLLGASASKLNLDQLWSGDASASGNAMADADARPASSEELTPASAPSDTDTANRDYLVAAAPVWFLLGVFGYTKWSKKYRKQVLNCEDCLQRKARWIAMCCQFHFCSVCLADGYLRRHMRQAKNQCTNEGTVKPIDQGDGIPKMHGRHGYFYLSSKVEFDAEEIRHCHMWFRKLVEKVRSRRDRIRIEVYTNIAEVRARRSPTRMRYVYLIPADGSKPTLLISQELKSRTIFP
uniref:FAS1 domain-containing protein n=1 Tax=Oryza punctata TaxID=4537 RepID=A0A0E0M984_ORYPU